MQTRVYDHIIADPDIFGGKPIIEGTDVTVSALVMGVASGKSLEQVAATHGVTLDDVRAALNFAAQRADEAAMLHFGDGTSASDVRAQPISESSTAASTLGQRLQNFRDQIVASGEPLLSWDEIDAEVAERRGGVHAEDEL